MDGNARPPYHRQLFAVTFERHDKGVTHMTFGLPIPPLTVRALESGLLPKTPMSISIPGANSVALHNVCDLYTNRF